MDSARSDRILDEIRKRKEKEQVVDVEEERKKLVIFTLSGDHYAFYGHAIKEILQLVEIFYVPGAPDHILGVVNIRGDIESVIAINSFLGLTAAAVTPNSRIAVAADEEMRSGILVDSIEDVVDVPVSAIRPPLATLGKSLKEFVAGETTFNGRDIALIDIGRIFKEIAV